MYLFTTEPIPKSILAVERETRRERGRGMTEREREDLSESVVFYWIPRECYISLFIQRD